MGARRLDPRVLVYAVALGVLLAAVVRTVRRRRERLPRWTDHDVSDPGITL